jgi:hypothetical protein
MKLTKDPQQGWGQAAAAAAAAAAEMLGCCHLGMMLLAA